MSTILKRTGKWLLRIVTAILLLLVIVWLLLQTQWGKNIAKNYAVSYLKDKLQTEVSIAGIEVDWFNRLKLTGVYIEDRQKRKLGYIGLLETKYDLSNIFSNSFTISEIGLNDVQLNLYRSKGDSLFNFNFITEAFLPGGSETATTTPSKPFNLTLGKIELSQLQFLMDDAYGGGFYKVYTGSLKSYIRKLDLEKMAIAADYLYTDSVDAAINLSSGTPIEKTTQTDTTVSPFTFYADSVSLAHTAFSMQNKETGMEIRTVAAAFSGNKIMYNQQKFNATANSLSLSDHTTSFKIKSLPVAVNAGTVVNIINSAPFTFYVSSASISNNNFSFDDIGVAETKFKNSFDYNHIRLKDINIAGDSITYDGVNYFAHISNASLNEKSGFKLKQLKAAVQYAGNNAVVNNFIISTNNNLLQGNAAVSFLSADKILSAPSTVKINASINNSTVKLDDLLYFNPSLNSNASFRPLLGKGFFINTKVGGTLEKLHIPSLSLKEGGLLLLASADIYHPTDVKKLKVDFQLKEFSGTKKELLALLPPNTIPDSFLQYIPASFSLKGKFNGGMNDFTTDMKLTGSDGSISVKGNASNITDIKTAKYDLDIAADDLKVGKLLNDSSMKNFTGAVKIKGRGFEPSTADMEYNATVKDFVYNDYRYHGLRTKGSMRLNVIEADIQSEDSNLLFSSSSIIDLNNKNQAVKTTTQIQQADLQKLGFTKDSVIIKTNIEGNLTLDEAGRLHGTATVSKAGIVYNGRQNVFDSVKLVAKDSAGVQQINVTTAFADINLDGKYVLKDLPSALKILANKYYYVNSADTTFKKPVQAKLNINVHHPDKAVSFIPGLKSISPFKITSVIDTDSSKFGLFVPVSRIAYKDYIIDSFRIGGLNLPSRGKKYKNLAYSISFAKLSSSSFEIPGFKLEGDIIAGDITGSVLLQDTVSKQPRYKVGFTIHNDTLLPSLHFDDTIIINKNAWTTNSANVIYLNPDELMGTNLTLKNNNESLSVNAAPGEPTGLPLIFNFKNFRLRNISDILVSDTSLVDGTCNGNFSIQSFANLLFTSSFGIDSLKFGGLNAGNLTLDIKQEQADEIKAFAELKGYGNDLQLKGNYNSTSGKPDMELDIKSFNAANAAPMAKQYLDGLTGNIHGKLHLSGSLDTPSVTGNIKFDSVKTVYKDYNTYVFLPSGELIFDKSAIALNGFSFLDSAGKKCTITGEVYSPDFRSYQFNLKVNTRDFLAVGSKKLPDQLVYGPARANANLQITGTDTKFFIDGSASLAEKSLLTYIYRPDEDFMQGEGLIEFFDPLHPEDSATAKKKPKPATASSYGMSMNLKVTPSSTVVVMLDELTGDHLQLNGNADLNVTKETGGQMYLSGKYVLENGTYDLSILQVIRKEFTIQKGSSITWSGDPLKADMDITALYNTKTSAGELITDMQSSGGAGRQQMNFEVYLMLAGEILKPQISFKLDMPEKDQQLFDGVIYTRIKQINTIPAELNKQVIGLLALNRFIADNPFSSLTSQGAGNFETDIYNTAGQILTHELSAILGGLVKGVDIDLGLDMSDDYTSGNAKRSTNLKLGLSKSLADNRLSVYVGSSFALEGQNQNTSALEGLAGNIIIEYLLTKNGKYRVKVFRTTETELTLQSNVIKTGASFVFVFEFNKVKQLFKLKKFKKQ